MTREQLLLIKLSEEASEIAQMALKAAQFGLGEVCQGQPLNNAQRLYAELDDLQAAVEMLRFETLFEYIPDMANILKKIAKVNKYAAYSEKLGKVQK